MEYVNEVVEWDGDRRFAMKSVKAPFPMTVVYEFEDADGDGTLMRIRAGGDASGFTGSGAGAQHRRTTRNPKDLAQLGSCWSARSAARRPAPALPGRPPAAARARRAAADAHVHLARAADLVALAHHDLARVAALVHAQRCSAPAADPVAGSSAIPIRGPKKRCASSSPCSHHGHGVYPRVRPDCGEVGSMPASTSRSRTRAEELRIPLVV